MITKNDTNQPQRWVNGTLAIIHEITSEKIKVNINGEIFDLSKARWEKYDYQFRNGTISPKIVATYVQYPLKLAWAATIHKCQGQTFDQVAIDLDSGSFAHGQTYVALSRATSLESIY